MHKLSVIIPVFNSEKYLNRCINSLMHQTLDDIEYIFINDASTDNSLSIIECCIKEFPKHNIKLIDLRFNHGISNARNIGIANATGEYITHCDSDDWVDQEAYEALYNLGKENNADIVSFNYAKEFNNTQKIIIQPYSFDSYKNIKGMLNGDIFPSLWSHLIRRELITNHHLCFPTGLNMGEDLYFNIQAYYYSRTVIICNKPYYHYRHTENSICTRRTRNSIDSDIKIAALIEIFLTKKGVYNHFSEAILYRKFFSKLALIINFDDYNSYKEWLKVYPETHNHIMSFYQIEKKLRILLWLSAHHLYFLALLLRKLIIICNKLKPRSVS